MQNIIYKGLLFSHVKVSMLAQLRRLVWGWKFDFGIIN